MKRFLFLISIVALLSSACSNNENEPENTPGQPSSLTITLAGGNQPKAVGAPTQVEENVIYAYTVYVFDATNSLEKIRTYNSGTLTQTLTGLTSGTKKVAIIANKPASFPAFTVGTSYSTFTNATTFIGLDDQTDLSNGLVMTGEENVTLASLPANNTLTIPISRIVAKIKLGTITITPSQGNDPALFELEGIAIIKAKSLSSVGLPAIVTNQPFYSGLPGIDVQAPNIRTYLYEPITLLDYDERYFYIFANETTLDEDKTLVTLVGTYDGVRSYYPFRLSQIQRNTENTINITLRRLGLGSPDPETPTDPSVLDITIVPQDWVVAPVLNVEW